MRAPKVCAEPGCPEVVTGGPRCAGHQRPAWSGSTRAARLPRDWAKRRASVLARDRWRCQLRLDGCTVRATEVDHVVAGDDHRLTNLQAVCAGCHRTKTLAERPRR